MTAPAPLRVLVTGGTGLLGAQLLATLSDANAYRVTATRRPTSRMETVAHLDHVQWVTGDLAEREFADACLREADAVVHAAGLVSYDARDAGALVETNVRLTARLCDAALALGVAHFVYVSSIGALSPARRDGLIDESALTFHVQPDTSRYARSKYAAELEVWRAGEEGLGTTILSPSVVLGAGRWAESSAQLVPWVARGQRYYPPGGTGYVDARDVAAFAKTCLDRGPAGRRYIVSAENWAFGPFFERVAAELGVAPPATLAKAWQAELAWRGAQARARLTGAAAVLTRESARRSMVSLRYDNSASVAAGATYRSLGATIRDVVGAFRATESQGWSAPLT